MKWYQMRWAQKYWGKEARERYRRYLQSDAWKASENPFYRFSAGFRCRRCGAPDTEVHHERYNHDSEVDQLDGEVHIIRE